MMIDDDNDDQMIFGDLGGLCFPTFILQMRENLGKNLTQENCPDQGSNPGPLAVQLKYNSVPIIKYSLEQ